MTASNAERRIPAGYFVAVVLLAMTAYLGAFYGCVHRPTCVARQYYAIDWLGERYFLADAVFAPSDWVDRSIRLALSQWQKQFPFTSSKRFGIALRAYHDVHTTLAGEEKFRGRK